MSMTREHYEAAVASLRKDYKAWDRITEDRYERDGHQPYMLASFEVSCCYEEAYDLGGRMAVFAAVYRGYLTCHTGSGRMEFNINFSRDIDAADSPVQVEPCDTVAEAAGVGGQG